MSSHPKQRPLWYALATVLIVAAVGFAVRSSGLFSPREDPLGMGRKYDPELHQASTEEERRAQLADTIRRRGPEHLESLRRRHLLASTLGVEHKYAESEAEYRLLLAGYTRVQGAEHPDTLHAQMMVAEVLSSQKKYAEAETLQRQLLATYTRLHGASHRATLTIARKLAFTLQMEHRTAEARTLAQAAYDGMKASAGGDSSLMGPFELTLESIQKQEEKESRK